MVSPSASTRPEKPDGSGALVTNFSHSPGYIDDPVRHASNVNGATFGGGRISALFHPAEKFTVRLTAVLQDITSKGTSIEDVNRLTLDAVHGDLTQSRTFSAEQGRLRIYNLTADYDLGFADLLSATSYGAAWADMTTAQYVAKSQRPCGSKLVGVLHAKAGAAAGRGRPWKNTECPQYDSTRPSLYHVAWPTL